MYSCKTTMYQSKIVTGKLNPFFRNQILKFTNNSDRYDTPATSLFKNASEDILKAKGNNG